MSFFPRRILLATDGSEDSGFAREAALDLANKTDSELHVVHVGLLSPWAIPDTLSDTQYERLRQQAQEVLDGEVKKVQEDGGTVADAHLRMGRADVEVVKLADELGMGLIVMGNRGRETIARILLGSDAESIVRHAPCPVMVVRREE
ncbi:MAG: universal stress protein [Actinomycetota bacterium]|nr:universal stress protein [Actinomycetota bacterium]